MGTLTAVVDAFWLIGVATSIGFLGYGAYLIYGFQCNATEAIQRVIARLALHESSRGLDPGSVWNAPKPR